MRNFETAGVDRATREKENKQGRRYNGEERGAAAGVGGGHTCCAVRRPSGDVTITALTAPQAGARENKRLARAVASRVIGRTERKGSSLARKDHVSSS